MDLNILSSDWNHKLFVKACLNYKKENRDTFIKSLKNYSSLAKSKKDFFSNLSYQDSEVIKNAIKKITNSFGLPDFVCTYLSLIIIKGNVDLFADALSDAVEKILNSENIYTCYILSSHPLSEENKSSLIKSLEAKTKTKINPVLIIDSKLIFGIKVIYNGKTMLYLENSIVNIIRTAKKNIIHGKL